MNDLTKIQEFYCFLEEYALFLESMVESEKDKLESLLSNELKRVEQSVSNQQAVSMQIENFEKRRIQLQEQAGFSDGSLREIIEKAEPADQQNLRPIFNRMQRAAEQVKFLNEKSMKIVETNLQLLRNVTPPAMQANSQGYTQDGEKKPDWGKSASLFETKI